MTLLKSCKRALFACAYPFVVVAVVLAISIVYRGTARDLDFMD
jgi:hypothetical protein